MNNFSNDFHAGIKGCPSKGGRGNVTIALEEQSELESELMAQGVLRAHHDTLPEHINAVIQMLYAHQVIRI